jgi:uncharacterized protein (TIGR02231 family)
MRLATLAAIGIVALVAAPAVAADLDATSHIDNVTVYPDGASVTRIIRLTLPAGDTTAVLRDFPPTLDPSSLRVEGDAQGPMTIGAIDTRAPRIDRPPLNPEIEKRIEALKDERGGLDDKIAAASVRRKFAERFAQSAPVGLGDKGEARPLAEWRAAFAAVADEVAAADTAIREAQLRQREIDRELARLAAQTRADPPRKMEVRIELAAAATTTATLRVSYSVRGARWQPLYDARLATGRAGQAPSLELVRRAQIVQNTGEDWSDVALAVSTVRTARGGNAPDLSPMIVHYYEPRPISASRLSMAPPAPPASVPYDQAAPRAKIAAGVLAPPKPAEEIQATMETGGFQVLFKVPGRVSVPANQGPKAFRIATATIAPGLLVRAVPALDETAFLEASFKQADEAPLLPGAVALYRDNVFVGRSQMALVPKDEIVRLGFGADDRVKVSRTTVRKIEAKTGIISSAKTDEREFKITLRNAHETPMRIVVEDQLPVSEIDDVKVELLPISTSPTERDVRNRRGVLAWTIDLKPGESRDLKLAWRVRWPADKTIVYGPGRP